MNVFLIGIVLVASFLALAIAMEPRTSPGLPRRQDIFFAVGMSGLLATALACIQIYHGG